MVHVPAGDDDGQHARGALGPEGFLKARVVEGDGEVRQGQDFWCGAVILFEHEALGLRIALGEAQNIGEVSASEAVDRLAIVANHHEVAVVLDAEVDDLALDEVGVLVFVDQDMLKARGVALGDLGVLVKESLPVNEEIIEVHQAHGLLALSVALGDRGEGREKPLEMRGFFFDDLLQRAASIDAE